jgi:hypothetical protein
MKGAPASFASRREPSTVRRRVLGSSAQFPKNVVDQDRAHLRARHPRNFEHRHSARGLRLDLDLFVVEFAVCRLLMMVHGADVIVPCVRHLSPLSQTFFYLKAVNPR